MELDRRDWRAITVPLAEIPTGATLDVTFDDGVNWHPVVADGDLEVDILVGGLDADGTRPNGVQLDAPLSSRVVGVLRGTAYPQVIHVNIGVIDIVDVGH